MQGQVLGVNSFYYPAFCWDHFFSSSSRQFTFLVALVIIQFGRSRPAADATHDERSSDRPAVFDISWVTFEEEVPQ